MPKFRTWCTWDHVTCGQHNSRKSRLSLAVHHYRLLFSTIAYCSRLSLTVLDYRLLSSTSLTVLDYCLLSSTIAYCPRLSLTVLDYRLSILDYRLSVLVYRMSVLDYRLSVVDYSMSVLEIPCCSRLSLTILDTILSSLACHTQHCNQHTSQYMIWFGCKPRQCQLSFPYSFVTFGGISTAIWSHLACF